MAAMADDLGDPLEGFAFESEDGDDDFDGAGGFAPRPLAEAALVASSARDVKGGLVRDADRRHGFFSFTGRPSRGAVPIDDAPTKSPKGEGGAGGEFWRVVQTSKSDMMTRMIKQKDARIEELTTLLEAVKTDAEASRLKLEREVADLRVKLGYLASENEHSKTEVDVLQERLRWYVDANEKYAQQEVAAHEANGGTTQQLYAANHLLQIRLNHMEDKYARLRGQHREFFAQLQVRAALVRTTLDSVRRSVYDELQVLRHWVGVQCKAIRDKAQVLHMSVNWNLPHDVITVNAHVKKVVAGMNQLLGAFRREMGSAVRGESLTAVDITPVDYHAFCTARVEKAAELQRQRNVLSLSAAVSAPAGEIARKKWDFTLEDADHLLDGEAFKQLEGYRGSMACLDQVAHRCKRLGKALEVKKTYQGYRQGRLEVKRQLQLQREETGKLLGWFTENVRGSLTTLTGVGREMHRLCAEGMSSVEAQMFEAWRRQWTAIPRRLTELIWTGVRLQAEVDTLRHRAVTTPRPTPRPLDHAALAAHDSRSSPGLSGSKLRNVANGVRVVATLQEDTKKGKMRCLVSAAGRQAHPYSPGEQPTIELLPPNGDRSPAHSPVPPRSPAVSAVPSTRPRSRLRNAAETAVKETQTDKEEVKERCVECRGPVVCLECHDSHRMATIYPKETLDTLVDLHGKLQQVEWDKVEVMKVKNTLLRDMVDFLCYSGRVKSKVGAAIAVPDLEPAAAAPQPPPPVRVGSVPISATRSASHHPSSRGSGTSTHRSSDKNSDAPPPPPPPPRPPRPERPASIRDEGFGAEPGMMQHKPGTAGDALVKLSQGVKGLTDGRGGPTLAGTMVMKNPTVIPLLQQQTQREAVEATLPKLPKRVPNKLHVKHPLYEQNPYISRCTEMLTSGSGASSAGSPLLAMMTLAASASEGPGSSQGERGKVVAERDWVSILGDAPAPRKELPSQGSGGAAAKEKEKEKEKEKDMKDKPPTQPPQPAALALGTDGDAGAADPAPSLAESGGALPVTTVHDLAAADADPLAPWANATVHSAPAAAGDDERNEMPPGSRGRPRAPLYVKKTRGSVSYRLTDSNTVERRKKRVIRDTQSRREQIRHKHFSAQMQQLVPRPPGLPRVAVAEPAAPGPEAGDVVPEDTVLWNGTGFAPADRAQQRICAAHERRDYAASVPKFPLLS